MQPPKTIIIRHRRENLKKCSLRGLEARSDFSFYTYPCKQMPALENYIILTLEAPPLSERDKDKGLLVVDATWRYADKMLKQITQEKELTYRSIPSDFRTAYPRRQDDCLFPERGLSSIEAIYISYTILGRNTEGLLDNYHWKELFFEKNKPFFL